MANDINNMTSLVNNVSIDDGDDEEIQQTAEDLPSILIVTNVPDAVFEYEEAKEEFEKLFIVYDDSASIQYLKSFRRARVQCSSSIHAVRARIELHERDFKDKKIKIYFAQTTKSSLIQSSGRHLQPPEPDKQFLISPPASPPVGWEPIPEASPRINYDLLSAIAKLAPGESHELHPPSPSQPGIVVHICEDPEGFNGCSKVIVIVIVKTKI
ncbi:calcipressin-3-like isoform X2 [Tubulanus polymorphus]|uniref:calcipressin-3-like isoform X2 n=1 Tax=Tubulanus polymorphus TaxID=672921 RepID=UPI003DA3E917